MIDIYDTRKRDRDTVLRRHAEWCAMHKSGKSIAKIARAFRVDESSVREALDRKVRR